MRTFKEIVRNIWNQGFNAQARSKDVDLLDQLMTIPDAAAALGIRASALDREIASGRFPSVTLFLSRRRVLVADILNAIQEQEAEAYELEAMQQAEVIENGF